MAYRSQVRPLGDAQRPLLPAVLVVCSVWALTWRARPPAFICSGCLSKVQLTAVGIAPSQAGKSKCHLESVICVQGSTSANSFNSGSRKPWGIYYWKKKISHVSGPTQFKPMLFKGQLCHVLVGLNNRNWFSHSSGDWKSKIRMSAGLVFFWGSLLVDAFSVSLSPLLRLPAILD